MIFKNIFEKHVRSNLLREESVLIRKQDNSMLARSDFNLEQFMGFL